MTSSTPVASEQPARLLLVNYSDRQLARLYHVDPRTLRKWLAPFRNEIGPRIGYFYSIAQVKIIFDKLGIPGTYILLDDHLVQE